MEHVSMVDDAGWCWFQDPRAIRHVGAHDRTYFGWISRFGDVTVGRYDHESGRFERSVIHEQFEPDDHDVPTLTVRPDGRIIVFYTAHNGPAVHYRIATSAESIASFGPRRSLEPGPDTNVTYPDPRWIDDDLHLFLRNRGSIVNLVSHDDGETWSEERELVSTGGTGLCVYSKISREHEGEVNFGMTHAIGGWNEPHRHVTHARFDGDALRTTDGDLLGHASEESLPVPIHETTPIYDSDEAGTDAWVWDSSIADGVPQVAYAQLVADEDHRYRYARWDGDRWQDTLVCHGGTYIVHEDSRERYYSGGIALDHDVAGVCYASVGSHRRSAITRHVYGDGGWASSVIVDDAEQNVRPVVPWNRADTMPVTWLRGSYRAAGVTGSTDKGAAYHTRLTAAFDDRG